MDVVVGREIEIILFDKGAVTARHPADGGFPSYPSLYVDLYTTLAADGHGGNVIISLHAQCRDSTVTYCLRRHFEA